MVSAGCEMVEARRAICWRGGDGVKGAGRCRNCDGGCQRAAGVWQGVVQEAAGARARLREVRPPCGSARASASGGVQLVGGVELYHT